MQMNDVYEKAIRGELVGAGGSPLPPLPVSNALDIPLVTYLIDLNRRCGFDPTTRTFRPDLPDGLVLEPHEEGKQNICPVEDSYLVFLNALSGAFVSAFHVTATTCEVRVTSWHLLEPAEIGPVPRPDPGAGVLIPDDSLRIVVGCGSLPQRPYAAAPPNVVVREQYWQALEDSYCIAPGESKEYNLTVVSGMQATSSEQRTVEASASLSAGAGWGPVSASVSAALSASSSTFQQVSINAESESCIAYRRELPEDHKFPMTVMHWQLTDCVTVYDGAKVAASAKDAALSSVITGTQPVVMSAFSVDASTYGQA